jgi:hypothetical protein
MGKTLRVLRKTSKKILSPQLRKKIKDVENKAEREEMYKYSIKSFFDHEIKDIEKFILHNKKKVDIFHISTKASLLKFKFKYYCIDYGGKHFRILHNLLKQIKKEIKEVENKI